MKVVLQGMSKIWEGGLMFHNDVNVSQGMLETNLDIGDLCPDNKKTDFISLIFSELFFNITFYLIFG